MKSVRPKAIRKKEMAHINFSFFFFNFLQPGIWAVKRKKRKAKSSVSKDTIARAFLSSFV